MERRVKFLPASSQREWWMTCWLLGKCARPQQSQPLECSCLHDCNSSESNAPLRLPGHWRATDLHCSIIASWSNYSLIYYHNVQRRKASVELCCLVHIVVARQYRQGCIWAKLSYFFFISKYSAFLFAFCTIVCWLFPRWRDILNHRNTIDVCFRGKKACWASSWLKRKWKPYLEAKF